MRQDVSGINGFNGGLGFHCVLCMVTFMERRIERHLYGEGTEGTPLWYKYVTLKHTEIC